MSAPERPSEEDLRSLSVDALVDAILNLFDAVDTLSSRLDACEERERHMLLSRRRSRRIDPPGLR